MKTICFLWLALLCSLCMQAQTTPVVSFNFTVETGIARVNFTNTSQNLGEGAKKAFWSFGDGTVVQTAATQGVSHQYPSAATYQVCLKIYRYRTNTHDSVLIGSACKPVTIEQVCKADFQWKDSLSTASSAGLIRFFGAGLSNAGKSLKEVCWKFGDGHDTCMKVPAGTSREKALSIVHQYSKGGVYNACIRLVFDGGCVAEKCNTVNVPARHPEADSCSANFTVQPTAASPAGRKFIAQPWHNKAKKPLRICWKFGDGKDTCIQYTASFTGDYRVEHAYKEPGQYEVCVSIKYDGGCESHKCNMVTVQRPTPPPTCEASLLEAAATAVSPERRFYVGLQANKVAEKVCWKFGDGSDTCIQFSNPVDTKQLTVTHRYPSPGAYTVCIRVVYAGGCVAERCKPVEIRLPQNNLCGGYIADSVINAHTILFRANSIHGPSDQVTGYLWSFGDGTTAGGQQVKHSYAAAGKYPVCLSLKTALGCETRICKPVVIGGDNVQPQLLLTPNPVTGTLTASFHSLQTQAVTVKIFSDNGILIKTYIRNAVAGNNTWTFDLGSLQAGVYSLVVQSPTQFATAIFFKQ